MKTAEQYFIGLSREEWVRERNAVLQQLQAIRSGVSVRTESSLLPSTILAILDENPPQ